MADEKENNFLEQFFQLDVPVSTFEFDKVFELDMQPIVSTSTSFDLSLVWETTSDQQNPFTHHDLNETIDAVKKLYKEQIIKTTGLQEKYNILEQISNETITTLQHELHMQHSTADAKVSDAYITLGIAEQKYNELYAIYNQLLDDVEEADTNGSKTEKTHQETLSDLVHKMVVLRSTTDAQLSEAYDAYRKLEEMYKKQITHIEQLQQMIDTYSVKPILPTWREDLQCHFINIVNDMPGNIYVRRPSQHVLDEI